MSSQDTVSSARTQNSPEDDLASKPNTTINVQKTPVSLLQVI